MLDHLVVAARGLDEGEAWLHERLGVRVAPGGRHPTMGTHNRVLSLGPGLYLEVIAVDPEAAPPSRPRWFGLDEPATRALLAQGPALLHWAERTDDLEGAARASRDDVEILAFTRGPYRWRMALTRDGRLPGGGTRPTWIQWDGPHPSESLPASGCRLIDLGAPGGGEARFATPDGERRLAWRLPAGNNP